jgi:hypothetical protein
VKLVVFGTADPVVFGTAVPVVVVVSVEPVVFGTAVPLSWMCSRTWCRLSSWM